MTTRDALTTLRTQALSLLPQLIKNVPVESIAFQGGLGRGKIDALSDIDLLLSFDSASAAVQAPKGELTFENMKWSIFHLCFDKVNPKRWKDKQRYLYAYETEIIIDPRGRLTTLCRKAMLSVKEQQERIIYNIKKIGNRGIAYQGVQQADWRGIHWGDLPDLWVRRNNLYAAFMRLNQVHELLIDLLFSLNGKPVPSSKWKHHLVTQLDWMPPNLPDHLKALSRIETYNELEFDQRRRIAVDLLTKCVDQAIYLDLLPKDMGTFYFSRFSTHSDNTEA